ncbi:MAG: Cu(I)-responsive transcriptional regulator [Herpetosiphon sp.]
MTPHLTIGQLAKQTGTTTKTIRYYETLGLLVPTVHAENRYRYYEESHVPQLRFIRRAQKLGLTLSEISQLMSMAREARCNELRTALDDMFARKIREHELQIAALRTLQRNMQPEVSPCACQSFVPNCSCLPATP